MTRTQRSSAEEPPAAVSATASSKTPTEPSAGSKITSNSGSAPRETYLNAYARLLINRTDLALRWTVAGGRAHWFCSRETLNRQALDWALQGRSALGLYAVGKTGLSRFLAFDADDDKAFQGLGALALDLTREHTVLVERSRRGGHCWVLFPPTRWQQVVEYGHHLTQRYGLRQIEQYPPSGELKAIKAPLTMQPKSRQIYPLIDIETGEVLPDPLGYLATLTPTPLPQIATPAVRYRADPFSNVTTPPPTTATVPEDPDALLSEASKYTTLIYKGHGKWIGKCPLHSPDDNPSFGVLNGTYWRCWANCCGEGRSHGGINALRARLRERGLLRE